jgi:hypothetical protein
LQNGCDVAQRYRTLFTTTAEYSKIYRQIHGILNAVFINNIKEI